MHPEVVTQWDKAIRILKEDGSCNVAYIGNDQSYLDMFLSDLENYWNYYRKAGPKLPFNKNITAVAAISGPTFGTYNKLITVSANSFTNNKDATILLKKR